MTTMIVREAKANAKSQEMRGGLESNATSEIFMLHIEHRTRRATVESVQAIIESQLVRMDSVFRRLS
jgi:hypothetical protein